MGDFKICPPITPIFMGWNIGVENLQRSSEVFLVDLLIVEVWVKWYWNKLRYFCRIEQWVNVFMLLRTRVVAKQRDTYKYMMVRGKNLGGVDWNWKYWCGLLISKICWNCIYMYLCTYICMYTHIYMFVCIYMNTICILIYTYFQLCVLKEPRNKDTWVTMSIPNANLSSNTIPTKKNQSSTLWRYAELNTINLISNLSAQRFAISVRLRIQRHLNVVVTSHPQAARFSTYKWVRDALLCLKVKTCPKRKWQDLQQEQGIKVNRPSVDKSNWGSFGPPNIKYSNEL